MKEKGLLLAIAVLMAMSCGNPSGVREIQEKRGFPLVTAPSVFTEEREVLDFYLEHFWDKYLDTAKFYFCDTLYVNGVHRMEVTQQAIMYSTVVARSTYEKRVESLAHLMDKLEAFQKADTSSTVFKCVTDEICEILYDENSPYRDEDLYATFAGRLAESPFTPENMREAYRYDVKMCSLNRVGTPATDFRYIDRYGKKHHLYGIDTDYTLVIFLNPGCQACEEIVEALAEPTVVNPIKDGTLTLLGMYIDEDIEDWLRKCDTLPQLWKDGYDCERVIRGQLWYNVRAIPSLYLLDKDKKVLLKDAPIQSVSTYLDKIYKQYKH